ncbi:4624_t:CDS:2, partial [Rhizophagus irregularis]
LDGEASSADEAAIADALPLLREHCSNYSLERIYNIDETELFYRLEPDWTLTTKHFLDKIVYEVPKDDKIIEELIYLFKNTDKENMDLEEMDVEEMDDIDEIPIISTNAAITNLETRTYVSTLTGQYGRIFKVSGKD